MGQAALTLLGVVLGAAIVGGVSLWQVQLVTVREREAGQVLREQERKDTHDAFQRDAILALHDALTAYWQTALVAQVQIHNRPTEVGQETVDHQAIFGPVRAAYWRMSAVRTKVFDDELRRLVNELSDQIDVILSMDVQQAQGVLSESYGLLKQIGDRINAPAQTAVLTCSWPNTSRATVEAAPDLTATGIAGNANVSSPPTDRTAGWIGKAPLAVPPGRGS